MPVRKHVLVAVASLALAACQSPTITTDVAPGANFAAYRSFTLVAAQPPAPAPAGLPFAPPAGANPLAYERIRQDIEASLLAKGYAEEPPGELSVIVTVGTRDRTSVNSWGPFLSQLDVHQYTQGELAVDVFDTRTHKPLWHGQASQTIDPDKSDPKVIDAAVAGIMAQFPQASGQRPAPSERSPAA